MLHLCTLISQYDIHKNALKGQDYYLDLMEVQNAPLTYSLWFRQTRNKGQLTVILNLFFDDGQFMMQLCQCRC
jgi:hypothetical protein